MNIAPHSRNHAAAVADNLVRLMIDRGLTLTKLSELTGVDDRTIRSIRSGKRKPSLSTYRKLADGLGVDAAELLEVRASEEELFDRTTNPEAAAFIDANPRMVRGWTRDDYADFFSRHGVGGGQTEDGARAAVKLINDRRDVLSKVAALMETPSSDLLRAMVDQMWKRERVTE